MSAGRGCDGVRTPAPPQDRERLVPHVRWRSVGLVWDPDGVVGHSQWGSIEKETGLEIGLIFVFVFFLYSVCTTCLVWIV